jgi:hypothetical protein
VIVITRLKHCLPSYDYDTQSIPRECITFQSLCHRREPQHSPTSEATQVILFTVRRVLRFEQGGSLGVYIGTVETSLLPPENTLVGELLAGNNKQEESCIGDDAKLT